MKTFFKELFSNNIFNFPFSDIYSRNLLDGLGIDADTNGTMSIVSDFNGTKIKTTMDADRNVVLNIDINLGDDVAAKNYTVDAILTTASSYFCFAESVMVNLVIDDEIFTFEGDPEFETFKTVKDGVCGYMKSNGKNDELVKSWVFVATDEKDTKESADEYVTTTTDDVVDETHVYTDDELDKYANFMCNVVCRNCDNDTCEGCEVLGDKVIDGDCMPGDCICDDEKLPWEYEVIPEDVEDYNYANFIKNKLTKREKYLVDYDLMHDNLKNVLVNNDYDIEDNYVVVSMEDLINTDSFTNDYDVVDYVLNNEVDRLESFLVQATNRFGFKSAKHEKDVMFGFIDLKFELPE